MLGAASAVFSGLAITLIPGSASADNYPQTQNTRVGGIDLSQYCQTNYGTSQSILFQIFSTVQIDAFPYVDGGRGPNAAYNWKCMMVTTVNGISEDGMSAYDAAMAAWDPADGPAPSLSSFAGESIDSQSGFSIDMNQACRQQYGIGAYAMLGNPSDITSWKCYMKTLTDFAYLA
jgi:hypothetical protein